MAAHINAELLTGVPCGGGGGFSPRRPKRNAEAAAQKCGRNIARAVCGLLLSTSFTVCCVGHRPGSGGC